MLFSHMFHKNSDFIGSYFSKRTAVSLFIVAVDLDRQCELVLEIKIYPQFLAVISIHFH